MQASTNQLALASSVRAPSRRLGAVASLVLASLLAADAAILTWIGGNNSWVDGGSTANWSPADEPDSDDSAVFNTNNAVNLGSGNVIAGLTLSAGFDLFTGTHFLDVNGDITLGGSSTTLNVGGNNLVGLPANGLDASNIIINSGATLNLGGTRIDFVEGVGEGLFDINAGGTLLGNGTLQNIDVIAAATPVLTTDGTLSVANFNSDIILIGVAPTPRTRSITATDPEARINPDGSGAAGNVLSLGAGSRLNLNLGAGSDTSLSGTIQLNGGTLNVTSSSGSWSIDRTIQSIAGTGFSTVTGGPRT